MRVLFITNHFLDSNGGGSFASRAYANAFAEVSDICMLLYPDRGLSIKEFIHPKYELKGVQNNKNKCQKLIDVFKGKIHRFTEVALDQITSFSPNIVVFDNSRCSSDLIKKVRRLGVKIITIHHNYEMEYYKGSPPNILWRIPFMYYMGKAEREAVIYSDLNLTLTDQDINLLQSVYDPNKQCLFERIGCFESTDLRIDFVERNPINSDLKFVITGSLSSYQTEVSLLPFLNNIYPKLLDLYPKSQLIIAGKDPSEIIKIHCAKFSNISLIPNPIDMRKIIQQADIYICPTNVGGGLKLRLMDGLKAGLPVITHEVSARGYDVFHENDCLFVYHDEFSFITELKKLVVQIGKNKLSPNKIKKIYQKQFSFTSGIDRLKSILK